MLFLEAGVIVGRDANGGDPVFTIAIVGEQLQTTLFEALEHPNNGTFDEAVQLQLLTDGAVQLQYTVTREDADGDSITQSATVDLISHTTVEGEGQEGLVSNTSYFSFDDDGPRAAVADAVLDTLVLDETRKVGTEQDGNSDPAGKASVSADFADNFVTSIDYGTDGPGDVTYALALKVDGIGSGLFALQSGDKLGEGGDGDGYGQGAEILLYQVGDVITGSVGGVDYFTISVDSNTGVVTFTQLGSPVNNIWHAATGSDDDSSTLTLENATDLQIVQTVADADGDSSEAAVALGAGVFSIEDDGPRASIFLNPLLSKVVHDETAGLQQIPVFSALVNSDGNDVPGVAVFGSVANAGTDLSGFATSTLPVVLTLLSDAGEDNEGATRVVSLELTGSADSGLTTTNGQSISLSLEGKLQDVGS